MTVRLDNILCATDFSEFSSRVTDYGIRLALSFNARLYVFHAVHFPSDQLYATDALERGEKQQRLSAQASEKIRNLMTATGIQWEPVVSCGEPVEEISRFVAKKDIDMVIAASHGLSGFKRILLGTVVERLARILHRPLLVIRSSSVPEDDARRPAASLNHILVGCDLWDDADPVLSFAMGFAGRLNADLHLLHAMEAPMDEDLVDPTQGSYGEVQNRLQDQLHRRLDRIVKDKAKNRLNIKTSVTAGLPAEALATHAERGGADLIIVGVRQRTILEKLIVGSTTEMILRHAPCPVLAIPCRARQANTSMDHDMD